MKMSLEQRRQALLQRHLSDSWVEVRQGGTDTPSGAAKPLPYSLYTEQMEKLLLEAQRESSRSSRSTSCHDSNASSQASPKSPHSPNNEPAIPESLQSVPALPVLQGTDWIWDWSSRPDVTPPSDYRARFKHPRRAPLSVRHSKALKQGLFRLENLPTLLLTHAATFLMGAAVMFVYLKKYCSWSAVTIATPALD